MKSLLLAVTALVAVWAAPAPEHLTGQALVDFVNANTKLWKAELNTKWTLPQFKKRLMNSKYVKVPAGTPEVHHEVPNVDAIPASFDARQQWPQCYSIGWIRDQSDCGSCWAFAAAEIASDRTCIDAPNTPIMLSAEDILACCGFSCGDGCEGGYPIEAMKWWVSKGVVTGTSYLDHQGCKPYSIPPCGHHNGTYYKECPSDIYPTPKCSQSCQSGYPKTYTQDKHFAKSAYKVSRTVSSIQTEIQSYGPVEAAFTVYEDFYNYKSGVYHHVSGQELGGHAVKLIGWGSESGTKYWLVANSWDTDWGESGFFRIRQGNDECGIEDGIVAGLPKN
jgi:cathepsin B